MVEVGILKSLWRKTQDGRWGIHDLKGLKFKPRAGFGSDFFPYESQMELKNLVPGYKQRSRAFHVIQLNRFSDEAKHSPSYRLG